MTPPNNYSSNGGRRVEFLPTIDSGAPEEPQTHTWDSETDHLLSYFLSDQSNNGHSTPGRAALYHQEFTSAPSNSKDITPPLGMTASYGLSSSRTSSNSTLTEAEPPQPRTPALQFYHPGKSQSTSRTHQATYVAPRHVAENMVIQNQSHLISSSSSSSLSSMAAALVSGGAVLQHQIHHRHQTQTPSGTPGGHPISNDSSTNSTNVSSDSPTGQGDDSPISPAAMIGTGHENLMLPPPSRRHDRERGHSQSTSSGVPANLAASSSQEAQVQQRPYSTAQTVYLTPNQNTDQPNNAGHLAWLKQINAQAEAARQNPMAQPPCPPSMMPSPATLVSLHSPSQQVLAQHPGSMAAAAPGTTHIFHARMFPNVAAAAVAENPMVYQAALSHTFHIAAHSHGESEEKRARRLERNRESARKSRRRKKERLATLEAQVDELHTQIEDERRNQVNAMCAALKQVRRDEFAKLMNDFKDNPDQLNAQAGRERLATILLCSSGGSQIAQACTEFQYNTLRHVLLPRYQKFLLWLTLHDESFFSAGKDEYTRKDGKQVLRVSSGRVSSKQIGDEVTNGWKTEKPDGKEKSKADTPDIGERSNPTSRSLDASRMWPLLCYELSVSVDQEERLLQAVKRLQEGENLANFRSQMAAATQLTSSLTEAISSQCKVSVARENRSFLQILSTAQAAKFQEWVAANQDRCTQIIGERRPTPEKCYPLFRDSALIEFCKRLEEVLRISKKEQDVFMGGGQV